MVPSDVSGTELFTDLDHDGRSLNPQEAFVPAKNRLKGRTKSLSLEVFDEIRSSKSKDTGPKMNSLYKLLLLELNLPGDRQAQASSTHREEDANRAIDQLLCMIKVPYHLEKFLVFGLCICLNSFLTLFTLMPLKVCILTWQSLVGFIKSEDRTLVCRRLQAVKRDFITLLLIICSVSLLSGLTLQVSRLYHDIRGQAHIKLYVMFGVLEVTDKLLLSLSLEIFTLLVEPKIKFSSIRRVALFIAAFILALAFFTCHAYVLIYQSVSLHVAANSYSNALIVLLLSNQFAELKGAVFKKFDREGLFQVAMSDLTERFQLSIMLFVIAIRNISQLSNTQVEHVPNSWRSINKWVGAILGPSVVVLGSEILVDWLKHCFINKFNRMRPRVYKNFLFVLSSDYMEVFTMSSNIYSLHEVSDYLVLTKRIGLPLVALTICFLRMSLRDIKTIYLPSTYEARSILSCIFLFALTMVALLFMRLLLSLWLLYWARKIRHEHENYQEELKFATKESTLMFASHEAASETLRKDDDTLERPTFTAVSPEKERKGSLFDTPSKIMMKSDLLGPASPTDSEIESSFIPGIPNTESSSINPTTRSYLYDFGDAIPPTLEEQRNANFMKRRVAPNASISKKTDALHEVRRYEMSSKRIW